MSTVIDLMLLIREHTTIFYHKDTNQFDYCPVSAIEMENLSLDARIPYEDTNNFRLPSYEEIDHKGLMRFFVKECVYDQQIRKQLFDILRRYDFIDAYIEKLYELDLYEDFVNVCGDIYYQIFDEWAEKYGLVFKKGND